MLIPIVVLGNIHPSRFRPSLIWLIEAEKMATRKVRRAQRRRETGRAFMIARWPGELCQVDRGAGQEVSDVASGDEARGDGPIEVDFLYAGANRDRVSNEWSI